MKSFLIRGIYNPYITAFRILGSNNYVDWKEIKSYSKFGTELLGKEKAFTLEKYSPFYRFIKYQHIESTVSYSNEKLYNNFGMFEFDLFGIIAPVFLRPFITCQRKGYGNRITLVYIFINCGK